MRNPSSRAMRTPNPSGMCVRADASNPSGDDGHGRAGDRVERVAPPRRRAAEAATPPTTARPRSRGRRPRSHPRHRRTTSQPAPVRAMCCTAASQRTRKPPRSASRRGRLCMPSTSDVSGPLLVRPRRAIMPRISEPCSRSSAAILGNAEASERRRASPAKIPRVIGEISRSAASRPRRRAANCQTVSSSAPRRPRHEGLGGHPKQAQSHS